MFASFARTLRRDSLLLVALEKVTNSACLSHILPSKQRLEAVSKVNNTVAMTTAVTMATAMTILTTRKARGPPEEEQRPNGY